MKADLNLRKRTRILRWSFTRHYVQRPMGEDNLIELRVDDELEPDRLAIVQLSDDDALRLAAKLARLVGYRGYRLVQVPGSESWTTR